MTVYKAIKKVADAASKLAIALIKGEDGASLATGARILERRGDRGFWPQQEARISTRRPRQRDQPAPGFDFGARPPPVFLADIGLDHADIEHGQRVIGHIRRRQ